MFVDCLKITLENIRGVKRLEYEAPTKAGVYVLTGVNGSGKSTLLAALARISDSGVFGNQFRVTPFDSYKTAKISYHIEKEGEKYDVFFSREGGKWRPHPKNCTLAKIAPFAKVVYISTSNQRFTESRIKDEPIKREREHASEATPFLKAGMQQILNTDKFEKLEFQTIKNVGGRNPKRGNRVYYITMDDGGEFSELNFSLGERMVLNALDALENIKEKSLLLIDEIELALHPAAQIRFYDYLKKISSEKNLMVIVSTHSPSLIRYASQRHYLEPQPDGVVEVKENCYPSYILRDVGIEEETTYDYMLFVEDCQARRLLRFIIEKMKKEDKCTKEFTYKIVCVGGWEETIRLMEEFMSIKPYSKRNVEAFPDKDAEDSIEEIRGKDERYRRASGQRKLNLWNRCESNICPLHITPELAIWKWLETDQSSDILEQYLETEIGRTTFRVKDVVTKVSEMHFEGENPRKIAKQRLETLVNELSERISDKGAEDFYNLIFKGYVDDNYKEMRRYYKKAFCEILGRK